MKTRFLRHRQILMSNYQQAESEIQRIDEIHHDSIAKVLKVTTNHWCVNAIIMRNLSGPLFRT